MLLYKKSGAGVLPGGNIVEQNEPKEFFANPQHPRLKDFLSKVL